jgi:hypothetical protein
VSAAKRSVGLPRSPLTGSAGRRTGAPSFGRETTSARPVRLDAVSAHESAENGSNTAGLVAVSLAAVLGALMILLGIHGADRLDRRPTTGPKHAADKDQKM